MKYPRNVKDDQNTPKNLKMTEIHLKSKKLPKYPLNLKMTEIPHKPKNDQVTPLNLKIDQKYPINLKND